MSLFSSTVLTASRRPAVRRLVTAASPVLVERFVAGETTETALRTAAELVADGRLVTLDHLGEDTADADAARANVDAYLELLARLGSLAPHVEVSVKLSALGSRLSDALALEHAERVCAAAEAAGTTVTVDMEDHTTTDATLAAVAALRRARPWVGAVLQAALRRTEADCRLLTGAGSRVRLVKGAYAEPAEVAHQGRAEVDAAYARCLEILVAGRGYPMVATHDPRLIALVEDRAPGTFEFQMLYGVREAEQRRLAAAGHRVRVYTPYGADWYGYFSRRLAERPANLGFLLRSLVRSH